MKTRARVFFGKQGELRFIGHRDLVRTFERALRRSGVELKLSEGFHPKAKLSFPLALAVGIEGRQEVMEVEFDQAIAADELLANLQEQCPQGLVVTHVEVLTPSTKKAQAAAVEYVLPLPANRQPAAQEAVRQFWSRSDCSVTRPGRKTPIDVRADLEVLEFTDGHLRMRQKITSTASARPREILELLGIADLEHQGNWLARSVVELVTS